MVVFTEGADGAFSERVKCGENVDPCAEVYASSSQSVVASQVSFPRKEAC